MNPKELKHLQKNLMGFLNGVQNSWLGPIMGEMFSANTNAGPIMGEMFSVESKFRPRDETQNYANENETIFNNGEEFIEIMFIPSMQ